MDSIHYFPPDDHANMVSDQVRMDAFFKAISEEVKPEMTVAEVGTGTGILSAFAAHKTKNPIYAIEYDEFSAQLSKQMFVSAKLSQIQVLRGKSYDIQFPTTPDLVITETIGALGPEESIVEICHDLKSRYPNIRTFLPSRLKVYLEPVRSKTIRIANQHYFNAFDCASFGTFDYSAIRPELETSRTSTILYGNLQDAESKGPRQLIAEYKLGESKESSFNFSPHFENSDSVDAIHIFFEATLNETTLLSSHYSAPETHWRHAYVVKPETKHQLHLHYRGDGKPVQARWT
jgi:hypothetical protein